VATASTLVTLDMPCSLMKNGALRSGVLTIVPVYHERQIEMKNMQQRYQDVGGYYE